MKITVNQLKKLIREAVEENLHLAKKHPWSDPGERELAAEPDPNEYDQDNYSFDDNDVLVSDRERAELARFKRLEAERRAEEFRKSPEGIAKDRAEKLAYNAAMAAKRAGKK